MMLGYTHLYSVKNEGGEKWATDGFKVTSGLCDVVCTGGSGLDNLVLLLTSVPICTCGYMLVGDRVGGLARTSCF